MAARSNAPKGARPARAASRLILHEGLPLDPTEPHADRYLKDVLTRLPTQRASEIDQLLAHNWSLPTLD